MLAATIRRNKTGKAFGRQGSQAVVSGPGEVYQKKNTCYFPPWETVRKSLHFQCVIH
jgi:hypothetical protein